jgi:polar amino acid transport system substrate-binding protein
VQGRNRQSRRRRLALVVAAAVSGFALLLSGCAPAGSAQAAPVPTLAPVPEAVALLPQALRDSGTLRVAIPTNEPPTQFFVPGTQDMTGVNPDIARLIADALGLKVEIAVTNFDSIIPGLAADRYDLTVSSMTPTEERMQQLDFVDYVQMGSALVVPAGNPNGIEFEGLCGKRVAVLKGSYQLAVNIPTINQTCTAAGQPEPEIFQFQDTTQAVGSMLSDRTDVVYADSPILGYAARQNPRIEVTAENDVAPVGVGMPRGDGTLPAVAAALQHIVTTPEYRKVLDNYGLSSMALTDARVNAAQ